MKSLISYHISRFFPCFLLFTAILTGKGEEPPLSSSSKTSSLLISSTSPSTISPSFSSSHMTTKTESNLSSSMSNKSSTIPFQQLNQSPFTKSTINENKTSLDKNDLDMNLSITNHINVVYHYQIN